MIEQLCYTWSATGLSGLTGLQVRAASDGVADINSKQFMAFDPYLRYSLPAGTNRNTSNTENSPFCLAYANAGDKRILIHKVYCGRDAYGRPGVYFAHLLAELPTNFSARDAIKLWKSDFWLLSEEHLDSRSVKLPHIEQEKLVSEHDLSAISEQDLRTIQEYLPFIIQAYLSLGEQQQLYIAARDSQIAALIWGLTHSLPRTMQAGLTFSTYEHDVSKVSMRIVGTCRPYMREDDPSIPQPDLPSECYDKGGLALNCYSGRHSALADDPRLAAYARFATDCLLNGQKQSLENLLALAEGLNIIKSNSLLIIHKYFTGEPLSPEDITFALEDYRLAAHLLKEESFQRAVIDLVKMDSQWWKAKGEATIVSLYTYQSPTLAVFVDRVERETYEAFLDNHATALLNLLYVVASPSRNPGPWVQLLIHLSSQLQGEERQPSNYSWELRLWLLQQWAFGVQSISDNLIYPWLPILWKDLMELLSLPLPFKWQTLAIKTLITSSRPIPRGIASWVTHHHNTFLPALQSLAQDVHTQQDVLRFFKILLEDGYQKKLELLSHLLTAGTFPPAELDNLLHIVQLTPLEEFNLLRQYSRYLLADIETVPQSVQNIIMDYMHQLTWDQLEQTVTRELLQLLQSMPILQSPLYPEIASSIRNWHLVAQVFTFSRRNAPRTVDKEQLRAMGKAIQSLQLHTNKEVRNCLYVLIVNRVYHCDQEGLLRDLVESLALSLIVNKQQLLYEIAAFLGSKYTNSLSYRLLVPYITLALDYALSIKKSEEKFLVPLFKVLLANVDRDILAAITRKSEQWSPEFRQLWLNYQPVPPPSTLKEWIGDLIKFPATAQAGKPVEMRQSAGTSPVKSVSKEIGNKKEIDNEWIEKVFIVKKKYIPYRIKILNQKEKDLRNQAAKEILQYERHKLMDQQQQYLNDEGLREVVRKDIEIDKLIQSYLPQTSKQWLKDSTEKELSSVIKDFKKYCKKDTKLESITDSDLLKILRIFIRHSVLTRELRKTESKPQLEDYLNILIKEAHSNGNQ